MEKMLSTIAMTAEAFDQDFNSLDSASARHPEKLTAIELAELFAGGILLSGMPRPYRRDLAYVEIVLSELGTGEAVRELYAVKIDQYRDRFAIRLQVAS